MKLNNLVKSSVFSILSILTINTQEGKAINLVSNGSFESLNVVSGFTGHSTGETFTNWTVQDAPRGAMQDAPSSVVGVKYDGVEHVGYYWQAEEGNQSVDLNRDFAGSIYQDLITNPNKDYLLSFALAGNPDGGSIIKTVQVNFGNFTTNQTFNIVNSSRNNMRWQNISLLIPKTNLTENTTRLSFTSLDDNAYGAAIDNVSIIEVPESNSVLGVLGIGISGLIVRRVSKT